MAAHGSRWAGSDNEIMSEPIETATRAAFGELVALLREIDARYLGPEFRIADPSSIVDGHAFALNLLSAGIDLYLDADPERPRMPAAFLAS